MAALSEAIVREFFEGHGFLVCQPRKFATSGKKQDDDIDFLVSHPRFTGGAEALPEVLAPSDLRRISRAVVVVNSWHSETFGSWILTTAPQIFRFLEPPILKQAIEFFGTEVGLRKILVLPALPRHADSRKETIRALRERGIDAVLSFQVILRDLIDTVETNRNYQKSDVLQLLRILKNYDLIKGTQMELFRTNRRARRRTTSSKEEGPPS